jgi:hypothetical protein
MHEHRQLPMQRRATATVVEEGRFLPKNSICIRQFLPVHHRHHHQQEQQQQQSQNENKLKRVPSFAVVSSLAIFGVHVHVKIITQIASPNTHTHSNPLTISPFFPSAAHLNMQISQ